MRSLLLVLTISIGVALAGNAPDVAAASSAKIGKHKAHKTHKAHRTHSGKKQSGQPSDVWSRLRSGMKIPSPIAQKTASTQNSDPDEASDRKIQSAYLTAATAKHEKSFASFSSMSTTNSRPQKSMAPANHYSELGRMKLGKRQYTELGKKLLAAKMPSTGDCGSSNAAHGQNESSHGNLYKAAFLKLKGSDNQLDSNAPLTSLANRIRLARSKSERPCAELQTASNKSAAKQQKIAENSRGWQNSHADVHKRQAMIDDRINKYVLAYSQNPDFLYRVAKRAHPYLYHIVEELSQRHLPLELALLPIVESAYQPTAESQKSAKGLWQFIPGTGKDYHLVQNHNYDERLDIPKSTQAAIHFLSDLNSHFKGDWLLALAAYNSGQATVDNAVSQNQSHGYPADFWSLNLPEETQNYVPRLLALSKIFARPDRFGIKLPAVKNEPYFVKVRIDREFDVNYLAEKSISAIAKLANLSEEQFCRLNPSHLGGTIARMPSYLFLMPTENANQLRQSLASIAQFMSDPALPLKNAMVKEQPQVQVNLTDSSLSLVSELVLNKPHALPKLSTPFLSLSVENDQGIIKPVSQPLA